MKKSVTKSYFFVCLSSDSWQFQKQVMKKSETHPETHLGFKPYIYIWLYMYICIYKLSQINRNLRKIRALYLLLYRTDYIQFYIITFKITPTCASSSRICYWFCSSGMSRKSVRLMIWISPKPKEKDTRVTWLVSIWLKLKLHCNSISTESEIRRITYLCSMFLKRKRAKSK